MEDTSKTVAADQQRQVLGSKEEEERAREAARQLSAEIGFHADAAFGHPDFGREPCWYLRASVDPETLLPGEFQDHPVVRRRPL